MVSKFPENGSLVSRLGSNFQLVFDGTIFLNESSGDIEIVSLVNSHDDSGGGNGTEISVKNYFLNTTVNIHDTLAFEVLQAQGRSCPFPKGDYQILIPYGLVLDVDSQPVNILEDYVVHSELPCFSPDFSGVYGLMAMVGVVCLLFVGVYTRHVVKVKKQSGTLSSQDSVRLSQHERGLDAVLIQENQYGDEEEVYSIAAPGFEQEMTSVPR